MFTLRFRKLCLGRIHQQYTTPRPSPGSTFASTVRINPKYYQRDSSFLLKELVLKVSILLVNL
jgi:hypothetical protein